MSKKTSLTITIPDFKITFPYFRKHVAYLIDAALDDIFETVSQNKHPKAEQYQQLIDIGSDNIVRVIDENVAADLISLSFPTTKDGRHEGTFNDWKNSFLALEDGDINDSREILNLILASSPHLLVKFKSLLDQKEKQRCVAKESKEKDLLACQSAKVDLERIEINKAIVLLKNKGYTINDTGVKK